MNCTRFQIKVMTGPLTGFILTDGNYDTYLANHQGEGYTYALLYGKQTGPVIDEETMMSYVEALCDSDNPVPDPGSIFTYNYGYTELDTTGEDELPEGDYVTALYPGPRTDVGSLTQYLGGIVTVPGFENDTDKVCWIWVPSSEAPFTKWSEVGNALQQDQPIDATYTAGTNAFFKTGNFYVTRSQTSFAGAIILSR